MSSGSLEPPHPIFQRFMADGSSARSPPGVLRDLGRRRAGGARPRSRARDSAAEGPTSWGALCVERALELHVPGLLADVVDWRPWQHARPRRSGRRGGLGHRRTLRGVAGLESERRDAATLLIRCCWRRVAAPCVRACVCVWCVPTRGVGASPSWVRRHEPVARVCVCVWWARVTARGTSTVVCASCFSERQRPHVRRSAGALPTGRRLDCSRGSQPAVHLRGPQHVDAISHNLFSP